MSNFNLELKPRFSLTSSSFRKLYCTAAVIIVFMDHITADLNFSNTTDGELPLGPDVDLLEINFITKGDYKNKSVENNSIIHTVPVTFREMTFTCKSSYPTSWKFHKPPFQDNSIQSIHIAKRLTVQNLTDFEIKTDNYYYQSNLTIKFKHFLVRELSPFTCRGSKSLGYGDHCTVIKGMTGQDNQLRINISKYDDSKDYGETRKSKIGVNKECNVTLVLDTKKKQFACGITRGEESGKSRPGIISCRTKDECVSIYDVDKKCNNTFFTECDETKHACFQFSDSPLPGVIKCSDDHSNSIARSFFTYPFTNNTLGYEFWDTATAKLVVKNLEDRAGDTRSEVYFGQIVSFQCKASGSFFSNGFQWVLLADPMHSNSSNRMYLGTGEERLSQDNLIISTKTLRLDNKSGNSLILKCFAPRWNRNIWLNESITFKVSEPSIPKITTTTEANCQREVTEMNPMKTNKTDADACISAGTGKLVTSSTFLCEATGKPLPEIHWMVWDKSGNKIYDSSKNYGEKDIVSESKPKDFIMKNSKQRYVKSKLCVHLELNTEYTVDCHAVNFFGSDKRRIECDGTKMNKLERAVIIGLVVALVVTASAGTYAFLWMRSRAKTASLRLKKAEVKKFEAGDPNAEGAFALPYNPKKFEINIYEMELDNTPHGILGMGQFGKVVKGTYKGRPVAVKMLKQTAEIIHFKALMSEIKLMCFMDKHPHLVNLVGAYTKDKHRGNVFLVTEFCEGGNLLNYLKNAGGSITYDRMITWAYECSCAMEYLSLKNFIHKDIAARNILLTADLKAKVGDFGISKQLEDFSQVVYHQRTKFPLPLKWMAVESLERLEFSTKSDVWSYGILLWEIFSRGETPYPGLPQFDHESYKLLLGGFRMDKPTECSDDMYALMMRCWEAKPQLRPTFSELREGLLIQCLTAAVDMTDGGNVYINHPGR